MKRSELKESIKAEITSILSEEMSDKEREDKLQQAKRGGGKEKPLRKLAAIGKKEDEENLKEALNPEVTSAVNRLIKGMAKKYGYEEKDAVFAIQAALKQREFDNPTFADIREDEKFSSLREAKSAADVDKEVKDLESKMKDKAKDFKAAEGKAKDKIKDELKDMTTKRNDLKKKVEDLKKKEEEKIANKGKDQELDA